MRTLGAKDKVAVRNTGKKKIYLVELVGLNQEFMLTATNRFEAKAIAQAQYPANVIGTITFSQYE